METLQNNPIAGTNEGTNAGMNQGMNAGMNQGKNEGKTTTMIEEQTARVPSIAYLALAVGSMAASAALMLAGRKQLANFIGQWAPSLLVIGLYNKVVKIEDELLGSQQGTRAPRPALQRGQGFQPASGPGGM